jgi:hypothetical protein
MRILPLQTPPPSRRIERRHTPGVTTGRHGYQNYRPCLRWEFGFTCAFCLLHEADLFEHGAQGSGLTSIEHRVPASTSENEINRYDNCFYSCRFCNGARSNAPLVDAAGSKLLDPCSVAWADHFVLTDEDRLAPLSGDASYTEATYDLNEPRKTRLRRMRRERIQELMELLVEGPRQVKALLDLSQRALSMEEARELLRAAELLRGCVLRASMDLPRYTVIPKDSDATCRCGRSDHHTLPAWLDERTLWV